MEQFRQSIKGKRERAILVGAILKRAQVGDDLAELSALAESADVQVVRD